MKGTTFSALVACGLRALELSTTNISQSRLGWLILRIAKDILAGEHCSVDRGLRHLASRSVDVGGVGGVISFTCKLARRRLICKASDFYRSQVGGHSSATAKQKVDV